jgi:hypothetical protein
VRKRAWHQVDKWEQGRLYPQQYVKAWRRLLDLPSAAFRRRILGDGDEALAMQNTSFGFLVER